MQDFYMHRVLFLDDCVVKYNNQEMLNEGDTQAFVHAASTGSPDAPRVPEVYACFSWDGMQYLVMERIHNPSVQAWIDDSGSATESLCRMDMACRAVGEALRWLFHLSPPVGADIGLLDGPFAQTQSDSIRARSGYARHRLFGVDAEAPLRYTGAPALERHINEAIRRRPKRVRPPAVEIADEPLVLVQADITTHNFLIDPETLRVTLIDFGWVSVLPRSFVSLTLHSTTCRFVKGINLTLNWERSRNIAGMAAAAVVYGMSASRVFGLDKDGSPLER